MTQTERRTFARKVKAHVEERLKDACREAVKAYWPISDTYDPEATEAAKAIYEKFKKSLRKTMKEVRL